MSNLPRVISSIVFGFSKAVGRAAAASGQQMVKNFNYKPDGLDEPASSSSSGRPGSKAAKATAQMQLSLDEAYLILNTKPTDSMETIEKAYQRIFTANGPPPEPKPKEGEPPKPIKKSRAPVHSHYLQSKVYRALERIKAEREAEAAESGAEEGATTAAPPAEGLQTPPPSQEGKSP